MSTCVQDRCWWSVPACRVVSSPLRFHFTISLCLDFTSQDEAFPPCKHRFEAMAFHIDLRFGSDRASRPDGMELDTFDRN